MFVGKTTLVYKILQNWERLTDSEIPVHQLILVFEYHQKLYENIIETMKQKFPNIAIKCFWGWREEIFKDPDLFRSVDNSQTILIVDDSLAKLNRSETLLEICRGRSHHEKITTFLIFQDITACGAELRAALKQMRYFIIMKGTSELLLFLQKKLYPYMGSFLQQAFQASQEESGSSYPYILLNNSPDCQKSKSVLGGIFEGENALLFTPSY